MILLSVWTDNVELGILVDYALCELLISLDGTFSPPVRQSSSLVELSSCEPGTIAEGNEYIRLDRHDGSAICLSTLEKKSLD